jgi:hypothetical protein
LGVPGVGEPLVYRDPNRRHPAAEGGGLILAVPVGRFNLASDVFDAARDRRLRLAQPDRPLQAAPPSAIWAPDRKSSRPSRHHPNDPPDS